MFLSFVITIACAIVVTEAGFFGDYDSGPNVGAGIGSMGFGNSPQTDFGGSRGRSVGLGNSQGISHDSFGSDFGQVGMGMGNAGGFSMGKRNKNKKKKQRREKNKNKKGKDSLTTSKPEQHLPPPGSG